MALFHSIPCRLTPAQVAWLDRRVNGAISTRSEALRHVLEAAMQAEASPDCLHASCPLRARP